METKKSLRFILRNFQFSEFYYFNYANLARVPKSVERETRKLLSIFSYGSSANKKLEKYFEDSRGHVSSIFGGNPERWYFLGPVSSVIINVIMTLISDNIKLKGVTPTITTYSKNFPSLILPIKSLEKLNLCKFSLLEYPEEGISLNWLEINIKSDIFIISLVDFFNGFIHDLDMIYDYTMKKGIKLIVDFSQFPYLGILNISNYPGAIFISVLHKWIMGYPGNSIAYIDIDRRLSKSEIDKQEFSNNGINELKINDKLIFDDFKPFFPGWRNMVNLFDYNENNFTSTYEISNRNILPFTSFEGSFKFVNKIGIDKINKYIESSNLYLLEKLNRLSNEYPSLLVKLCKESYKGKKSSIIAVSVKEKTKDLFKYIYHNKIISSFFDNDTIRFSTSFITTKEEIDFLILVLSKWFKELNEK